MIEVAIGFGWVISGGGRCGHASTVYQHSHLRAGLGDSLYRLDLTLPSARHREYIELLRVSA